MYLDDVPDLQRTWTFRLVVTILVCGTSLFDEDVEDGGGKYSTGPYVPQVLEKYTVISII